MSKGTKNYLDDFDFCLRKSIAVHVFGEHVTGNQAEFAEAVNSAQPTLSKWLNRKVDEEGRITSTLESRHVPTAAQIILASAYLSMSVAEMIDKAIEGEEKSPLILPGMLEKMKKLSKDLHEKGVISARLPYLTRTSDYLKKIWRTAKSRYAGFFLQDEGAFGHLIIETFEPLKTGSVPMVARVIGKAGNPYRGSIVSPPANDHLYFYIRQEDGKNDRGVLIFYIDDDIQGAYECGSGILISNDRKTGHVRLQWVIIWRIGEATELLTADTLKAIQEMQAHEASLNMKDQEFEKTLQPLDEIIRPLLEQDMPNSKNHQIQFEILRERHRELYTHYTEECQKQIKFAENTVKYAKARYEAALKELDQLKEKEKPTPQDV